MLTELYLRDERGQIEARRHDYVERVDDNGDPYLFHIAENSGQECACSAEEHIICISGYRTYKSALSFHPFRECNYLFI